MTMMTVKACLNHLMNIHLNESDVASPDNGSTLRSHPSSVPEDPVTPVTMDTPKRSA